MRAGKKKKSTEEQVLVLKTTEVKSRFITEKTMTKKKVYQRVTTTLLKYIYNQMKKFTFIKRFHIHYKGWSLI